MPLLKPTKPVDSLTSTTSTFEKRLKRRVSGKHQRFFAVCPPGLTPLCLKEIEALAPALENLNLLPKGQTLGDITPGPGGVSFSCRLDLACLANLFLGTPTRILMRMARFRAENFNALEKELGRIDWELFLPRACLPRIQVTARKSRLYHSDALAQRAREILVRQEGMPKNPAESPDQTLMIRGENNWFELSMDMSGLPLFKRGIKERVIQAPLRETLAYAMLKKLHFSPEDTLMDPMSGSGTFSLEGAMIKAGIPPGFFRSYAFQDWPGFQSRRFDHAKKSITGKIYPQDRAPADPSGIYASDMDPKSVEALIATRESHPFLAGISVDQMDFFDIIPPKISRGKGVIVLNPPYGKRLGKEMDIQYFFKEMGQKLTTDFKDWHAGIICPKKQLLKELRLPLTPMPLFHGGLDLVAGLGRII